MEKRNFELWDFDTKSRVEVEASKQGNTWMAHCPKPEHPDKNPSLKIDPDKKRYFCFGCRWKGVFYNQKKERTTGQRKVVSTFDYQKEDGSLLFQVVRYEPKDFQARRFNGNGEWIYNIKGVELIPYRLPQLWKGENPVFIVEGEKHVDRLIEMGLTATTNPFGAGKWRESYNRFFKDREIIILPDNDSPGKEHCARVAGALSGHAKSIKVFELPGLPEKGDILDWLKQGGTKEQLLELIEKTNFYKPSLDKPSENSTTDDEKKIKALLDSESSNHNRYSAQEFLEGKLCLGALLGKKEKVIIRSDKEIILQNDERSFIFTESKLTRECIKRFREGETVSDHDLLSRLTSYFFSHTVFTNKKFPLLISVWVMGSYLFKLFPCYGYLWINSSIKRCGKSHLLDLLSHVCFNATKRTVNPSEASIFRRIDVNKCTFIMDEVEKLRLEDREKSDLITLLNLGYEKGGEVSRCEGKVINVVYFDAYSPKVLAGINSVIDTVEDRSFLIKMERKLKTERVDRLSLRRDSEMLERLRQDLYIWALNAAEDIHEVYEEIGEIAEIKTLDDRAKDVWEPLLVIAKVIDGENGEWKLSIFNDLVSLALEMGETRAEREKSDNRIVSFIELVKGLMKDEDREIFISSEDLFSKIRLQLEDVFSFKTKVGMASFLKKWGLYPVAQRPTKGEDPVRGYRITRSWVEEKELRYA